MLRSGSAVMTGILNMGDHKITNLVAGTSSKDAVNKEQMDTALSAKQATITGGASTITSSNLTASRALVSSSSGKVAVSAVTATELGYLDGVTSAIQTQLNNKANNNAVVHLTGNESISGTKTFAAKNIFLKDSGDDRSSAPSSSRYAGYVIEDVNGERLAIFEKAHGTNGEITASMLVSRQGTTGAENQIGISVIYPSSGNGYATCPTPTDTNQTNSNQIDTVGARNTRINDVLAALYPVGSIYIGTQSTCPLATLISGSTWTKISGDKVLQSSSSNHAANTTIAAGLPNITGKVGFIKQEGNPTVREPSGAFSSDGESSDTYTQGDATGTSKLDYIKFQASKSNSIYGNSSTVQPPAYVVNVWRRTA